jgi:hypothetical protein
LLDAEIWQCISIKSDGPFQTARRLTGYDGPSKEIGRNEPAGASAGLAKNVYMVVADKKAVSARERIREIVRNRPKYVVFHVASVRGG